METLTLNLERYCSQINMVSFLFLWVYVLINCHDDSSQQQNVRGQCICLGTLQVNQILSVLNHLTVICWLIKAMREFFLILFPQERYVVPTRKTCCSHRKDMLFPQHTILFPQHIILFAQYIILFLQHFILFPQYIINNTN